MAKAYGALAMESRVSEALGLGLRANGYATWAPLVLAMAKMERLVFLRVSGVVLLQTHDL